MRGNYRGLPAAIALIALLAVTPLVHSHPLTGSDTSGSTCAVCAASVDRLPPVERAVTVPLVVVETLTARSETPVVTATILPRASRAPPA